MKFAARLLSTLSLCLLFGGNAAAQNLVTNGNFESGLDGWNVWSVSSDFWDGTWLHTNDCDIWLPAQCPYGGAGISHAQKKGIGSGNAHGGLYQVINVIPGHRYRVSGRWSGGATGNAAGNATWWEVVAYNGAVSDAVIDQAPGPQDVLIAKEEILDLANNGVYQFQWQPFSGEFVAASSQITLALKTGSYFTFDVGAYHDDIVVQDVTPTSVPVDSAWMLGATSLLLAGAAWARRRGGKGR